MASQQGQVGLTEAYRREVEAALPRGVTVDGAFWDALWAIVGRYLLAHHDRMRDPLTARAERWSDIEKQLTRLKENMTVISDPQRPSRLSRLQSAVDEVEILASKSSAAYRKAATEFRGRRDPHRDRLYGDLLDLWCDLQQPLTFSRTSKNQTVGGPLIRFFAACLGPVLGHDALKPEGIADVIRRKRTKRRRHRVRPNIGV